MRILIILVAIFGSGGIAAAGLLLMHVGGQTAGVGPCSGTLSLNLCLSTGTMGAAL